MDGLMIHNNQDMRPSLTARGKGAAPRKALANIQNTHHTKSVSFDNNTAPLKPSLKIINQLKGNLKSTTTPINKPIRRLGEKPSTSKKGFPSATTPFKIFEDGGKSEQAAKSSTRPNQKIDIFNDEIEYMPPCTDREVELKMPKYLQKACLHKPQYNITLPLSSNTLTSALSTGEQKAMREKTRSEVLESNNQILQRLPDSVQELESDDNLVEFIEDNFGKLCVASDDELFAQFDSDDSFSLESLDREIREAGLDPPNW